MRDLHLLAVSLVGWWNHHLEICSLCLLNHIGSRMNIGAALLTPRLRGNFEPECSTCYGSNRWEAYRHKEDKEIWQ